MGWRRAGLAVTCVAALLLVLAGLKGPAARFDVAGATTLASKLAAVQRLAAKRSTMRTATATSELDLSDEEGDNALAVASSVKGAVGGGSEEGENLADAE